MATQVKKVKLQGSLEQWLRMELLRGRSDGYITRLELCNYNPLTGTRADACQTWEVPESKPDTDEFNYFSDLAQQIEKAALDDGAFFVGPQTYELRAFTISSAKRHSAHFHIPVDGTASDAAQQLAGTERGSLALLQGLVNTMSQRDIQRSDRLIQMTEPLLKENVRLSERVEKLEQERLTVIELTESLMTKQHERELMTAGAKFKQEQMREIVGAVKPLIPAMVNKWRGDEIVPGAKSPLDVMFTKLIDQLVKKQLEAMAAGQSEDTTQEKFTSFIDSLPVDDDVKMALGLLLIQEFEKGKARYDAERTRAKANGADRGATAH